MENLSRLKFGEVNNVLKELNQKRNNEKDQRLIRRRYEMLDIKTQKKILKNSVRI